MKEDVSPPSFRAMTLLPARNFVVCWGSAGYVMLHDAGGAEIHLTKAAEDWLVPDKSSFGIYFYADNVEELAHRLKGRILHPPRLRVLSRARLK